MSGIWGEYALSPLKWPRGKMGARCRERDYASDRHSQFWGDIKLCLCEACWMHLIYIQLGFLVRNPQIRWVPSCVHAVAAAILEPQWDVCIGRHCPAKEKVIEERPVWRLHWTAFSSQRVWVWQLTQFPVARKERPGLNNIVHPDWVKLSVELNLRAKPKYKIFLHYNNIPNMASLTYEDCHSH